MKKRHWALGIVALLGASIGTAAYVATPTVHEGTSGDAPELGRFGDYAIGTKLAEFDVGERPRIGQTSLVTGGTDTQPRSLSVRLWYPAEADGLQNGETGTTYRHTMDSLSLDAFEITSTGRASEGAAPVSDQQFPLVVMSHGFGGWSTQFSNLAEHIASRGYVVASIEHADMKAEGLPSFLVSFGNVLLDRSLDQRDVIDQLLAKGSDSADPVCSLIDPKNVALIGYSMGGYGAFATAGAPYSFTNDPMAGLPDAVKDTIREANTVPAPIKALVAFAPWGGQPDNRAWAAVDLAKVSIPTLIVAGDQDDVINYDEGVRWLFDNLTGTNRHMLVYREARHNIVGNDFEIGEDIPFAAAEFMSEPVWRSDRLNAINQHFVAAFLDLHLKGDTAKSTYLDVPTVNANDSVWPTSLGEQLNGKLAGEDQDQHWRGFQRRWAAGLEMHRLGADEDNSVTKTSDTGAE